MRFVGFIGPSYQSQSKNVDRQRCINLYPELDELGTGKEKEVASLVATPGLRLLVTLGVGPIRGIYTASNGQNFAVSANKLYRIDGSFAYAELGTLETYTGQVSIADNGFQLIVVDGPHGYVWDFALLAFNEISDPAFPGADQVTFQDGYFIFNKPDSGQFFISGLDEVTFDALDIATSEGNPDNIVGIISDHRNLWLFNEQSTEVFYDSGAADFPFERVQGAFVEHGCAARFSIAKMNNTVFWLGKDDKGFGMVFMAQGYQPQRISTHAIETAIQSYSNISDACAWTYQQHGHHFYVLNFPTAETTWVFDTATNLWHERVFTNQGQFERHRADCHAVMAGMHVVGDYQNGNLYELSIDQFSDNGNAITRRRISPHLSDGLSRIFHSTLQLDVEVGVGLDGIGQGTDPQVMLRWSDDGGHKWSNEKWASMGKIGEKKRRVMFRRLGQSRDRVYEVTITDPVKVTIIGAELQVAKGGP